MIRALASDLGGVAVATLALLALFYLRDVLTVLLAIAGWLQ